MEIPEAWFSEQDLETEGQDFMIYDDMKNNTVDNISVYAYSISSPEIVMLVDQSFHIHQEEMIKTKPDCYQEKISQAPVPLIATTCPSSNTFTISFGNMNTENEIQQFPADSLGFEAACTTNQVHNPTTARTNFQAQDHVLAERKRREKLNQHFISLSALVPNLKKVHSTEKNNLQAQDHVLAERKRRQKLNQHFIYLSALLPNLKKMDKATVLEDASNRIKELQYRVKELEGLQRNKRKDVQECVISMKRSKIFNSDDEYSSFEETDSGESIHDLYKLSPKIEVRISGTSVLVIIQCQKKISSLVNTLNQMQKLGLSIITSSSMPFAKTHILITIVAEIEDNFCMTTKELMENLQLAI